MGKATDGTKEEEEGGGGALGDGRTVYRGVADGLQLRKRRGRCRGGEVRGGGGGEEPTAFFTSRRVSEGGVDDAEGHRCVADCRSNAQSIKSTQY